MDAISVAFYFVLVLAAGLFYLPVLRAAAIYLSGCSDLFVLAFLPVHAEKAGSDRIGNRKRIGIGQLYGAVSSVTDQYYPDFNELYQLNVGEVVPPCIANSLKIAVHAAYCAVPVSIYRML